MKALLFFFSLIIFNCNCEFIDRIKVQEVIIETSKNDTIVILKNELGKKINVFRDIQIIDNENVDTLLLGFSIIHPKYIGIIRNLQSGINENTAIYVHKNEALDINNPSHFCNGFSIRVFNKSNASIKKIKLRLQTYESEL